MCDEDETYDDRHTGRRQMAQESGDEGDSSDEDSAEEEDRSDDEDEVDNNSDNGIPKERKKPKVVENKIPQLGGVRIEDMRKGKGPAVKSGNKVAIYFDGRLESNNKSIHKHSSGKEYEFTVGKGEVIQGWDIGIVGMRAGGKRKIICPPEKAWCKGHTAIPPDATLVYEIELRRVF